MQGERLKRAAFIMENIYPLLYQYLLSNKILLLPKIGTFSLSTAGGRYDYASRKIQAPVMSFSFNGASNTKKNDQALYAFLSKQLNVDHSKAEEVVDQYSDDLWNQLQEDKATTLPGLGELRYINENVLMETDFQSNTFFPDADVLPVKREGANTIILSGDREFTRTEMEDELEGNGKKSKWWIYVLVILVIGGIAAAIWYYLTYMQTNS